MLHDYDDHVVLTWTCDLGRVLAEREWRASMGEPGEMELFPSYDVRLPLDIDALSPPRSRASCSRCGSTSELRTCERPACIERP
jgi:hypothetical protein